MKKVFLIGILVSTMLDVAIFSLAAEGPPLASIKTTCGLFGLCGTCSCSGTNCTGGNGTWCLGQAWCQCTTPGGTSSCSLACPGPPISIQ